MLGGRMEDWAGERVLRVELCGYVAGGGAGAKGRIAGCARPSAACEARRGATVRCRRRGSRLVRECAVESRNDGVAVDEGRLSAQDESLELLDWRDITKRVSQLASTECGREVLAAAMPVAANEQEATVLLAETRDAITLERSESQLDFSGAGDVERSALLASRGGLLTGPDLSKLADTLLAMRKNKRVIENFSEDESLPALESIVEGMKTKAELEQEIRRCVDEEGKVRDSASPELLDVRKEMKDVQSKIAAELNVIMSKRRDALQDRIVTQRYDRAVLAVKASHKSKVPGSVHDSSATGQTLYVEPQEVQDLNNKARVLVRKEAAIEEKILRAVSDKVGLEADDIEHIQHCLTRLDLANARARHSIRLGAVEPTFLHSENEEGFVLELREARHPLLLWQVIDKVGTEEAPSHVVPSDFTLFSGTRCAIVTGPNTGGKTVSLKTLGLAVLMARAGLFVCAGKASLPFFDRVLADIGDDQSIVQSLSTFSGHVERLKGILEEATPGSLVLLDEVGSGTDPAEGSALGISVLRRLSDTVRLVMATTHHGELKRLKYADEQGRFENASVEFDNEKMRPTFRLVWGIPGRSNALAIAERLGLDGAIVDDAKEYLSGGGSDLNVSQVIAGLEAQRKEADAAARRLQEREREVNELAAELRRKTAALEADARETREKVRSQVAAEFESARKEVREVVRSMQKSGASSKAAGEARSKLDELSQGLEEVARADSAPVLADELKEGDLVVVERLGDAPVTVVERPNNRGDVWVMLGKMKMKVKVKELARASAEAVSEAAKTTSGNALTRSAGGNSRTPRRGAAVTKTKSSFVNVKTDSNTVDVRGKRVDEALDTVREAINSKYGFGALWIVHGHGTGALKHAVRDMLRKSKLVAKYEDAERLDGGSGATVVQFM